MSDETDLTKSANFHSFLKTFDKIEPLSNIQIIDKCQKLKIKNFKGVFMRDEIKNMIATENECFILNLDHSSNNGTHWTCLFISDKVALDGKDFHPVRDGVCYYFDSFGFPPPIEVEEYLHKFKNRYYSSFEIQKGNQVICGHFSIYILFKLSNDIGFYESIDEVYHFNS